MYDNNSASLGAGSLIVSKYNTGYAIRINGGAGLVYMDIDTFDVKTKGGMSVRNESGTALSVNGGIMVNGSYGVTVDFMIEGVWVGARKYDIALQVTNGLITSYRLQ